MKTLEAVKKILAEHRDDLRARFGVRRIAVFGSYARGDQTPVSDVDVVVDLERPMGWEIVDLHVGCLSASQLKDPSCGQSSEVARQDFLGAG